MCLSCIKSTILSNSELTQKIHSLYRILMKLSMKSIMIKTTILVMVTISVLLTGAIAGPMALFQSVEALKSQGNPVPATGSKKVCGDRLCSEIPEEEKLKKEEEKKKEQVKQEKKTKEAEKAKDHPLRDKKAEKMAADTTFRAAKTVTGVITSVQDPGKGHEGHQLAIILPPNENVYRGHLSYTATENVQLVALHGPLSSDMAKGQAIWTPDGKTMYGLAFVDNGKSSGFWQFSGNALALHTTHSEPFSATYAVTYTELSQENDNVLIGTQTSTQDPAVGHETYQLAIILPLNEEHYRGNITFDASEPVRLVSLIGPLPKGLLQDLPQWTTDGETFYGMVLGSTKSAGSVTFTGNAIGFHTENTNPFTVNYSLVLAK